MKRREATFDIPDMKCEGCADRIERVLTRHDGVQSATVRLDDKQATVLYDADAAGTDALRSVLEKAGYTPQET